MKIALAVLALFFALPLATQADEISYDLTVTNAPGGIGNMSWDLVTNGFIPPATLVCTPTSCTQTGFYNDFLSLSAPSNGDGCAITDVFASPGYAFTTFFSPSCDGLYDSLTAGVVPQPGETGTWTWTGTNPNDTQNTVTLTVTDLTTESEPISTPEPSALALLLLGIGALTRYRRG
jgi:hypothetical protein